MRRIWKLTVKAIKSVKQNKSHLKIFFCQRPSYDIGTKYLQKKFFIKGLDLSEFALFSVRLYPRHSVVPFLHLELGQTNYESARGHLSVFFYLVSKGTVIWSWSGQIMFLIFLMALKSSLSINLVYKLKTYLVFLKNLKMNFRVHFNWFRSLWTRV